MKAIKRREERNDSSSLPRNNSNGEFDSPYKVDKNDIEIILGLSEDNPINTINRLKDATKSLAKTRDIFPLMEDITEATIHLIEQGKYSKEMKEVCYKISIALVDYIQDNHRKLRDFIHNKDASPLLYDQIFKHISLGDTLFQLKGALMNALNVEHRIKLSAQGNPPMTNYLSNKRRLKRKKGSF